MPVPGGTICAEELSEREDLQDPSSLGFTGGLISKVALGMSILSGKSQESQMIGDRRLSPRRNYLFEEEGRAILFKKGALFYGRTSLNRAPNMVITAPRLGGGPYGYGLRQGIIFVP